MSGTITPQILLRAYAAGIFPMAEDAGDNSLYWVEPEERGILPLSGFHVPRSLAKTIRRQDFDIRVDTQFEQVMRACSAQTDNRPSTWINDRIINLYKQLHKMGCGHCVECWHDGELVGGLYGIRIGAAFFGESMFSRKTDASKVALVHLVARLKVGGFALLDAQFKNDHLTQFGLATVSRDEYHLMLEPALGVDAEFDAFDGDDDSEKVLRLARQG
ncbi:Leucyl/phenylalanyl-tRNA--protein transferase [hydrothermal vent metagenome]|uniref:Leucyl/phenylalanyl-tRNA--protein transferase n=1 Tax=hydrothermal vent metagenome TaxID=652676 RepID=A0A3B0S416_9ZZZZ